MFRVINNLYLKAKSCVSSNESVSTLFTCQVGVRQVGNLPPLLFSIYLSDLKEFLSRKCDGLNFIQNLATEFVGDAEVVVFLKLHLLLYADDTVILAEIPNDLQLSLNSMAEYCKGWKLSINVTKTQVMTFSRGKIRNKNTFYFEVIELVNTDSYKYLGIIYSIIMVNFVQLSRIFY